MQDKHTFEYAVIRIVPRVEREEFMNVGIVLYSRSKKFLQALIQLDEQRLRAFSETLHVEDISTYLQAFDRICAGTTGSGPIGKLDPASRFRWLTATRSTVVQTSRVHPGMCAAPEEVLLKLFQQLVLK